MNLQTDNSAFKVTNIHAGEHRTDLSKEWMSRPADQRFTSITELHQATKQRADNSIETVAPSKLLEAFGPEEINATSMHQMAVKLPNSDERAFSNWSFGQIATLSGGPAGYLRKFPAQLSAPMINYGLLKLRRVEDLKVYYDGNQVRAFTGPDYGRIYDHEVVSAVGQIAGNGTGDTRWKIPGVMDWQTNIYDPDTPVTPDTTTLFASDRDVFMFLVDDRNPIEVGKVVNPRTGIMEPDLMFRGFYVKNSEVGNGSLKLAAFYLRAICCNRIMWGVENFSEITMPHRKHAPERFIEQCRPALESFANGSDKTLIEGVARAKSARVANDEDDALQFLKQQGYSRTRSAEILALVETEEKRPARTVWDMAQGITAYARSSLNNDTRVELERDARKILDKVA